MKFALPVETTGPVGDAEAEEVEEVDVELLLDKAELELELVDD